MDEKEIAVLIAKRIMNIPEEMRNWMVAKVSPRTVRRWCLESVNGKGENNRPLKFVDIIKPYFDGSETFDSLMLLELEYDKDPDAVNRRVIEALKKFNNEALIKYYEGLS